mgnify:CR=1 FL=1
MMKCKKTTLLILFIYISLSMITAQDQFGKLTEKNGKREKLTELEFAFLGVGIKRFPNLKSISHGWGVNFQYSNFYLASNDLGYKSYLENHSFFHRLAIGDFLKAKYILRREFLKSTCVDLSPFLSISNVPAQGEETNPFFAGGLETEFSFLKDKKFGISTVLNFRKDFTTSHLYFSWQPVKLLIRFKNENK